MENNYYRESKTNNFSNKYKYKQIKNKLDNLKKKFIFLMIFTLFLALIIIIQFVYKFLDKNIFNKKVFQENFAEIQKMFLEQREYNISRTKNYNNNVNINLIQFFLTKEKERPYLEIINKKRTFEKRLPLTRKINCKPHFTPIELGAFLSFLTKDTVYFETGSGCSSIIAKYYAKKSYAVEGCKQWYEKGVKNGLKDNLIFRDLKPDDPTWSYPGKASTIEDWKNYFQAYNKSYNADVILIDGRFKVATAMDIFDKIREDTIVFIHEYPHRPSYFILENYYQFVFQWDQLVAFVKRKDV